MADNAANEKAITLTAGWVELDIPLSVAIDAKWDKSFICIGWDIEEENWTIRFEEFYLYNPGEN